MNESKNLKVLNLCQFIYLLSWKLLSVDDSRDVREVQSEVE